MSDDEETAANNANPVLAPNQAIESSRKLDTALNGSIKALRRGSLSGKINSLAEEMAEFEIESHKVVDGIREKIVAAKEKRDEAAEAQHAHYDGLIGDFQDSIDAVERLSNLPLESGGKR
jgi:hypothetical protein